MKLPAVRLARAWLCVALASGNDSELHAMYRTVNIEVFPRGVFLVATDRVIMARAWVPYAPEGDEQLDLDEEEKFSIPSIDEAPDMSILVSDPHGRGTGMFKYIIKTWGDMADEGREDKIPGLSVHQVKTPAEDDTLPGFEPLSVEFEIEGHELLYLPDVQLRFPDWRALESTFKAKATRELGLSTEMMGRVAKMGRFYPSNSFCIETQGANPVAKWRVGPIRGIFQPAGIY